VRVISCRDLLKLEQRNAELSIYFFSTVFKWGDDSLHTVKFVLQPMSVDQRAVPKTGNQILQVVFELQSAEASSVLAPTEALGAPDEVIEERGPFVAAL
jgi:hypothetical protein